MEEKEYVWTGKVSVWEGRAHQRGEILTLTEADAAPLLAAGAIEATVKSAPESPDKLPDKPPAKPPDKSREVKIDA